MERSYHREYSPALGREMEFETFGTSGVPMIVFPCLAGRFHDYADFDMVATLAPWIDAGRVRLFCLDSIDSESWVASGAPDSWRSARQESYHRYVAEEMVPRIREFAGGYAGRLAVTGNSMGGMHAAISFFRRPDLFETFIGLSGIYDGRHFYPGYSDRAVYENSPVDFLPDIPPGHPWLDLYRRSTIRTAIGQGRWEDDLLPSNHRLADVLANLGVPARIDFWGYDVDHDWPAWRAMMHAAATDIFGAV